MDEEVDLPLSAHGPYRIYIMQKKSWNTVDAIEHLSKASGVSALYIGYAGRKDRHAVTRQYISVPSGVRLKSDMTGIALTEVGFSSDFVSTKVLLGNSFRLILRALSREERHAVSMRLPVVSACGFPNYYDDQRFGSVTPDGFMAELLVKGQIKGALKMHMTSPRSGDKAAHRERKCAIAERWGKWDHVASLCANQEELGIVNALKEGGRKKNLLAAVNCISKDAMTMYLSTYQSALWNWALTRFMRGILGEHVTAPGAQREEAAGYRCGGRVGDYQFYGPIPKALVKTLQETEIPTVAKDILPATPEVGRAIEETLDQRQVNRTSFALRGVRNGYFRSFYRNAVVIPSGLSAGPFEPDERYRGFSKISLDFALPAGSYATMLIKALLC